MSKIDRAPSEYTLHVDGQGALVSLRGRASEQVFADIISELTSHPDFHLDLPSVWDMRETEGFGEMSRAELSRLVMISRKARLGATGYRVAMVAGKPLDYGVGRMLGGTVERGEVMEVGIFFDFEEAKRWAFREGRASDAGVNTA